MRVDFDESVVHDYNFVSSRDYFYLREKTPEMKNNAVEGIYTCEQPLIVPWNDDISKGDYLNVISFSRGKIYYFDENGNAVFPPSIKLKLVDQKGKTFFWECISQKASYMFSNGNKNSKMLRYYTIFLLVADILLILYLMFTGAL